MLKDGNKKKNTNGTRKSLANFSLSLKITQRKKKKANLVQAAHSLGPALYIKYERLEDGEENVSEKV